MAELKPCPFCGKTLTMSVGAAFAFHEYTEGCPITNVQILPAQAESWNRRPTPSLEPDRERVGKRSFDEWWNARPQRIILTLTTIELLRQEAEAAWHAALTPQTPETCNHKNQTVVTGLGSRCDECGRMFPEEVAALDISKFGFDGGEDCGTPQGEE